MNQLQQTSKLVKQILIEDVKARNSDSHLYLRVCETLNPSVLIKPFVSVLVGLKYYNLPPFETVRRARQKIQEKCPELSAVDEVENARAELETEYREFARGDAI